MDRYKRVFCSEKINGYFLPKANENSESAFNRAKAEAVDAYEASIKLLSSYSFIEFYADAKVTQND